MTKKIQTCESNGNLDNIKMILKNIKMKTYWINPDLLGLTY